MASPRLTSPMEFYNSLEAHRAAAQMEAADGLVRCVKTITLRSLVKYRVEIVTPQPKTQAA